MKSFRSYASCCVASLLTLLVLSEVCSAAAQEEGYKRGWRPQGRFGKRTLEQSQEHYEELIRPRTAAEDYLMDDDASMLSEMGSRVMGDSLNQNNLGLTPESKPVLWADGTVCLQKGPRGVYKCYRWRQSEKNKSGIWSNGN